MILANASPSSVRVGFSTFNGSPISWLIRKATRAEVSHAFLLVTDSVLGDMIMEEEIGGMQLRPYASFEKTSSIVKLVTPSAPIDVGLKAAATWLGERYDYTGVVGMLYVLIGRYFGKKWKNVLHSPHSMFCSEAIVFVLQAARYPGADALDAESTSPQDLLTFFEKQGAAS
jgi:hypothetical protein